MSANGYRPLRVAIALLALLATALATIMAKDLERYPWPELFHDGEIKKPILAVELARDRKDLIEVLRTTNPAMALARAHGCADKDQRDPVCAVRTNTLQDCFFIPLYSGLLLCLALLFCKMPPRRWLGMAGAALAITVALLDYAENRGIFKALRTEEITDQAAQAISNPSRAKWMLLGVTLLFIGLLICISMLPNFRVWVRWLLSASYWIAGLMLLAATARYPLFALATPLFGVLLLISAGGLLGPFFKRTSKPASL